MITSNEESQVYLLLGYRCKSTSSTSCTHSARLSGDAFFIRSDSTIADLHHFKLLDGLG